MFLALGPSGSKTIIFWLGLPPECFIKLKPTSTSMALILTPVTKRELGSLFALLPPEPLVPVVHCTSFTGYTR